MGIIGAGHWAVENHIPVLKSFPDVEVVAVCRPGQEQVQRVQRSFDIPFGTEDYRELLALKNLDGVVVSSPHHLHYEHTAAAIRPQVFNGTPFGEPVWAAAETGAGVRR